MDPTARGDEIAARMRAHYEVHRESWWDRLWRRDDVADNLMLGLMQVYYFADKELPPARTD